MLMLGFSAQAQSITDLLKGLGGAGQTAGSTVGNLIEGIFTRTDLTLADLVGQYESTGPAVTFQSENFLKKAGGVAGAAALETKLEPYYRQYGLTGMPMTIGEDARFTLTVKGIKLSGMVTPGEEKGTFVFNIMVGNMLKLGKFTAYVQKSGKNLDLMFDATKLKEIISTVAKFTGSTLASTLGTILDSYEGACIGFKMSYTGAAPSPEKSVSPDSTSTPASGIGSLLDMLSKGRGKTK